MTFLLRSAGGRALALALVSACTPTAPANDAGPIDAPGIDAPGLDGGMAVDAPLDAGPPQRVLFVGNSYTTYNDLPNTVRAVMAASGRPIEVEAITMDGAYLGEHLTRVSDRLAAGAPTIDRVVLQGQSLQAVYPIEGGGLGASATMFSTLLAEHGVSAVWYATWARRAGDPFYASFPEGPEAMALAIDRSYQVAAEVNDGDVTARVGIAWQLALAELPEVTLFLSDGSHPTPAGTLLAACVIADAMLDAPPTAPSPAPFDIAADIAASLCAIAPRARMAETPSRCDGVWVDLSRDPDHCGSCETACGADDPCFNGTCGCAFGTGCARSCVDLATDPLHCGACGTPCLTGALCETSECRCPEARRYETLELPAWEAAGCAMGGGPSCAAAAHDVCSALECYATGLNATGHALAGSYGTLVCIDDAELVDLTLAECALGPSVECATAVHSACRDRGAESGFARGPVVEGMLPVACLPSGRATVVRTPRASLPAPSRCTPNPVDCSIAAMTFCIAQGFTGGYGPVETVGDDVDVVCVGPPS